MILHGIQIIPYKFSDSLYILLQYNIALCPHISKFSFGLFHETESVSQMEQGGFGLHCLFTENLNCWVKKKEKYTDIIIKNSDGTEMNNILTESFMCKALYVVFGMTFILVILLLLRKYLYHGHRGLGIICAAIIFINDFLLFGNCIVFFLFCILNHDIVRLFMAVLFLILRLKPCMIDLRNIKKDGWRGLLYE